MPQNIIDTVFPVTQGEGFKPNEILPPFSQGAGVNNENSDLVKVNKEAPGVGVPAQSLSEIPASVSAPNSVTAGAEAPGVGPANDSPTDNSNDNSGDGPISVLRTKVALGTTDGGLFQPGATPVNVTQNNVIEQVFQQPGGGLVPTINGGEH
jgi:hypothetical protein